MDNFNSTVEQRLIKANCILLKYPGKIPVILEYRGNVANYKLEKKKFLLPAELTMHEFQKIILKRLILNESISIYLFAELPENKTHCLLNGLQTSVDIYKNWKSNDNFLYIYYNTENTFG